MRNVMEHYPRWVMGGACVYEARVGSSCMQSMPAVRDGVRMGVCGCAEARVGPSCMRYDIALPAGGCILPRRTCWVGLCGSGRAGLFGTLFCELLCELLARLQTRHQSSLLPTPPACSLWSEAQGKALQPAPPCAAAGGNGGGGQGQQHQFGTCLQPPQEGFAAEEEAALPPDSRHQPWWRRGSEGEGGTCSRVRSRPGFSCNADGSRMPLGPNVEVGAWVGPGVWGWGWAGGNGTALAPPPAEAKAPELLPAFHLLQPLSD